MSRHLSSISAVILFAGLGWHVSPACAENVDLSTVPNRDTVQLTIYNSEDLTLVRETRTISFKRGDNPLQFSWANTLIDPTSVELRFLTDADKLEVLDTTFPHAKPHMLYRNVQSELDGESTIEITYFTSGISWTADYVLVADRNEQQVTFEGYVRVHNNSGEEYEDASVRLVVGKVNLVTFELVKGRVWPDHIWLKLNGVNTYRHVDDGKVAVEVNGSVAGWDEHTYYIQHVRNFTGKRIELEIRRPFPGHIVFHSILRLQCGGKMLPIRQLNLERF